jgi:hypothetical protein
LVRTARNAAVGPASRAAKATRHAGVGLFATGGVAKTDEDELPTTASPYRLFSEIFVVIMGSRVPFLTPKDKPSNGLFLISHCFLTK